VVTAVSPSEHEQLAFVDLVLRRLAAERPDVEVEMVRAVEYEARVGLRRAVTLRPGSAFEMIGPRTVQVPRTRRALELVAAAADEPLPGMVPFVSAASTRSATVAAAPSTGCAVSATVADRAMALHWLAPWGRGEIVSVSTQSPSACQGWMAKGVDHEGDHGRHGPFADPPRAFLVFADEGEQVEVDHRCWGGVAVGVVHSPVRHDDGRPEALPSSASRISVGDVEYVLADRCP
jgi:hypothetical protein